MRRLVEVPEFTGDSPAVGVEGFSAFGVQVFGDDVTWFGTLKRDAVVGVAGDWFEVAEVGAGGYHSEADLMLVKLFFRSAGSSVVSVALG